MMKSQTGRRGFASAGPAKKNEGAKLLFAIGLLVVAGVVIAWTQGWIFSGGAKDSGMTPEEVAAQKQAFEEQQAATKAKIEQKKAAPAGSS